MTDDSLFLMNPGVNAKESADSDVATAAVGEDAQENESTKSETDESEKAEDTADKTDATEKGKDTDAKSDEDAGSTYPEDGDKSRENACTIRCYSTHQKES